MIKVYAFDFDGVISDSARGWAFFCRKAWEGGQLPPAAEIEKYRPYVRDALETYGLLTLLSDNDTVTREKVSDCAGKNRANAEEFAARFFNEKKDFISKDMEGFRRLYGSYEFMVPFMKKLAREKNVYIVTNNRKEQVLAILK